MGIIDICNMYISWVWCQWNTVVVRFHIDVDMIGRFLIMCTLTLSRSYDCGNILHSTTLQYVHHESIQRGIYVPLHYCVQCVNVYSLDAKCNTVTSCAVCRGHPHMQCVQCAPICSVYSITIHVVHYVLCGKTK